MIGKGRLEDWKMEDLKLRSLDRRNDDRNKSQFKYLIFSVIKSYRVIQLPSPFLTLQCIKADEGSHLIPEQSEGEPLSKFRSEAMGTIPMFRPANYLILKLFSQVIEIV